MRNLQIIPSITNSNSLVDLYFNDIGKEEMCTVQDEVILARKIRGGDSSALHKLTTSNLRFVVSVAKRYQFQGLPLADLINEGNLGLIKAAQRFDETRGFKFISFAVWWVRKSIIAAITENARMVRLPMNKIHEITKINKAIAVLEQDTLREPTANQVAAYLNMSPEKVIHALMQARWTTSIDTVYGDEEFSILDLVGSDDFPADKALIDESKQLELRSLLARLPSKERTIITLSFGLDGKTEMIAADIAALLGMSTERVRQLKNAALIKLKSNHSLN
jgi:RNA polymerase primary sigma factor